MKVSVVIPCYNSEATISGVVNLAREKLLSLGYDYEFVLVNDSSRDTTFSEIRKLCTEDKKVKGMDCARNFGQHNAIMAALHHVTGDYVLGMDDDFQTHPSQFPKLLGKLEEGWDVVFAKYQHQKQSLFRSMGTIFTRWTMRVLTDRPKDVYASSFWVARSYVCKEVIHYESQYSYIQGLFFRTTKSITDVEVEHFERAVGSSGYTLKSLIRNWAIVINFSITPLHLSTFFGALMGILGVLGGIAIVINKFLDPTLQLGWSSVMVTILLSFGLNLICLGVIGEYLGRLFMTINKTPQFVLREKLNCND
ncbi:MAG: glycosyltransferase family 2 protein [Candidatus Riflebacteria bacterium]|nr:glycosyltransferase family 2 protein [Candidatus Riflebacteria bacterium]